MAYGWRGSLLILAGILLHCLPCSMLLVSPQQPVPGNHIADAEADLNINGDSNGPTEIPCLGDLNRSVHSSSPSLPASSPALPASSPALPANSHSLPASSPALPASSPSLPASSPALPASSPALPASSPALPASSPALPANSHSLPANSHSLPVSSTSLYFTSGSPSLPARTFTLPNVVGYVRKMLRGVWTEFKSFFELLRDPLCFCTVTCFFFCYAAVPVPYTYIVVKARSLGLSAEDAPFLLTAVNIGELFGRPLSGVIASFRQNSPTIIFTISIVLCGVATVVMGFCQTYHLLTATAVCLGLASGK